MKYYTADELTITGLYICSEVTYVRGIRTTAYFETEDCMGIWIDVKNGHINIGYNQTPYYQDYIFYGPLKFNPSQKLVNKILKNKMIEDIIA